MLNLSVSATKNFPVFLTDSLEKEILRELELYLIYNPTKNLFNYFTKQRNKPIKFYSLKNSYLLKLEDKFYQASTNKIMYSALTGNTNNLLARMYITELLNFNGLSTRDNYNV